MLVSKPTSTLSCCYARPKPCKQADVIRRYWNRLGEQSVAVVFDLCLRAPLRAGRIELIPLPLRERIKVRGRVQRRIILLVGPEEFKIHVFVLQRSKPQNLWIATPLIAAREDGSKNRSNPIPASQQIPSRWRTVTGNYRTRIEKRIASSVMRSPAIPLLWSEWKIRCRG